ncbi:MAG: MBL fold metallo-hydrolase [Pseudomonadota bacterium]
MSLSEKPKPGVLTPLMPDLYRLCADNPSAMTGPGTNTYLYGSKELAVFDAGPKLASHIDNILNAQDTLNAPITKIFSSHTHSDHSPAVAELKKALPKAEVIGLPPPPGQDFEDLTFVADHEPKDNEQIMHDGCPVRVIYTPGHVANHICFLIEAYDFLLTGDHLMSGSTVVIIPPKGDMKAYIESLRKLTHYRIELMGPGHGPVMENPLETVEWTIEHRLKREQKVVDALNEYPDSLIRQLVTVVYADTPKHLHPIAEMSLHAHLLKLCDEQRAVERDGQWRLRELN